MEKHYEFCAYMAIEWDTDVWFPSFLQGAVPASPARDLKAETVRSNFSHCAEILSFVYFKLFICFSPNGAKATTKYRNRSKQKKENENHRIAIGTNMMQVPRLIVF